MGDGKGMTGIGGGFSKAIRQANDDYFTKCGLEATYAEYAKGQKCMIVYAAGTVPPEFLEKGVDPMEGPACSRATGFEAKDGRSRVRGETHRHRHIHREKAIIRVARTPFRHGGCAG